MTQDPPHAEPRSAQRSADEDVERALAGDPAATGRLLRAIDEATDDGDAALRLLHPRTGRAHLVGVTGVPGAGKSTLVAAMIAEYRRRGHRVAVLAIDPSSPKTGGAILGDRVRMQQHADDRDVFIRSIATRGALGGLSASTNASVHILDALGFDPVIVETVGVGQDEVDIAALAHTTVVVTVPGLGDEIQAIKAGVMEVADLFCINKADRDGADRLERQLRGLGTLLQSTSATERAAVSILKTIATSGFGVEALVDAISAHRDASSPEDRAALERRRAQAELRALVEREIGRAMTELLEEPKMRAVVDAIAARRESPYEVFADVLAMVRGKLDEQTD